MPQPGPIKKTPPERKREGRHRSGRPRVPFDWEAFDKLCQIQCTTEEICLFFECAEKTLRRACQRQWGMSFREYRAIRAKKGHVALRRMQWQLALKGNVTMIIWLAKNYLGQVQEPVASVTINNNPNPEAEKGIEQIKEILRAAAECQTPKPPLTLVPTQDASGLLSPS